MIRNINIFNQSEQGPDIEFQFERPSDMDKYSKKWKIDKESNPAYGNFECLMAMEIATLRSQIPAIKQYKVSEYAIALKQLDIPCDIPLMMIITGKDACLIRVVLLQNRYSITVGGDDYNFLYNTQM
jgi:hypothetical protein